jgi:TonB family protein
MKTKLPLIVCMLVLFAGAIKAQTPDAVSWQQYKVSGEMFSVALPILPAMHISGVWVEGATKPRRQVLLGAYADGVAYTVAVLQNPAPRQSLQEFIDGQIGSAVQWDFNNVRDVSHDGLSGRLYLSAGDGMVQFFVSEDRLYKFCAFGVSPDDPRVTKFFSSVSFNKTKDALEVFEGVGLPFEPVQAAAADDELANKIYTGKEVTKKARLAMKPEPNYTEEARQNAISGTVVLKCVFRSNGSVNNIRIVSGLPYGLTERAIEAARRIKFIPAMKDGKYASMWYQLEYNFNLY